MMRSAKKLGQILIERGLLKAGQLEEALQKQQSSNDFLGAILLKRRLIKEEDLLSALSEQYSLPLVSLKDKYIDWQVTKSFSSSLILDHKCLPFKKDDWSVTIAISNPLDAWAMQKAEEEARGMKVKLVLAHASDIEEAIKRYQEYLHTG